MVVEVVVVVFVAVAVDTSKNATNFVQKLEYGTICFCLPVDILVPLPMIMVVVFTSDSMFPIGLGVLANNAQSNDDE